MGQQARQWSADRDVSRLRFPDFFLVGHPKSGTTAMYDMLRQHPQIFMSPVKEPRFFNDDMDASYGGRPPMSQSDYLDLFTAAGPDQRAGEATPGYLRSRTAARNIAQANPAARIIAILREPVSLIRSVHLFRIRNGTARDADLRTVLDAEPDHFDHLVSFVEHLRRYRAVFPDEQVLALVYDEYRRSNTETMRLIFRFLDVDDTFEVTPAERVSAVAVRSSSLASALTRLKRSKTSPGLWGASARIAFRTAEATGMNRALRTMYEKSNFTSPPQLDERLAAELRIRFAPEVRKLSDYLDRDLCALWGYPER